MRPLDAYHGNHHTFWPRLVAPRGRHLSGLSDSTEYGSKPRHDQVPTAGTENRPESTHASPIGVGSDGRTLPRLLAESRGPDAGVDSSALSIPASIFEVATVEGREAAKERAGL